MNTIRQEELPVTLKMPNLKFDDYQAFRIGLRTALQLADIPSNPCWTDVNIVEATATILGVPNQNWESFKPVNDNTEGLETMRADIRAIVGQRLANSRQSDKLIDFVVSKMNDTELIDAVRVAAGVAPGEFERRLVRDVVAA